MTTKPSKRIRRTFSAEFKAKVAVEALKGQETVNQIAGRHEVHPQLVTNWKQLLLRQAAQAFEPGGVAVPAKGVEEQLYAQIGRLKMELEWLKKKLGAA